MQTKTFVDKNNWPKGEWNNEPDKAQWIDKDTDLDCLIVRNRAGALCGYVGISEKHRLFQRDYSDYDDINVNVHGGLTFSDFCREDDKEHGICHTPEEGRPHKIWWFGFDCAHGGDLMPSYHDSIIYGEYRNFAYVQNECKELASQLAKLA